MFLDLLLAHVLECEGVKHTTLIDFLAWIGWSARSIRAGGAL
jgi:hypothetical protein